MATEKIKCAVEGIIDLDRLPGISHNRVREVINSREFQRLRHIAQLGFSQYVYPGANHSRLSHSLGVFQGCQKAMLQLQSLRLPGLEIPDEWYQATALAALLHDIGHGPFSHSFEKVTGEDHEERTYQIIESGPELPGILRRIDEGLAERIIQVLRWQIPEPNYRFLSYLVSSQLDCDRLDYLRRDSLHSGAGYGVFDRDWILRVLRPSDDFSTMVILEKGRHAVEQYLIGRFHMYQCVYFHKTTRAFECAFQGLCRRLRTVAAQRPDLRDMTAIRALGTEGTEIIGLNDYLSLADFSYLSLFARLLNDPDNTIRFLASSIIHRKPLGCEESEDFQALTAHREQKMAEAREQELDPECMVQIDEPSDTPYKTYERDSTQPAKTIRLISPNRQIEDITIHSSLVRQMVETYYLSRLYFPRE